MDDNSSESDTYHETTPDRASPPPIEPLLAGLDFTFWTNVQLTVIDVTRLKKHKEVLGLSCAALV
jgi:hypothetical protein